MKKLLCTALACAIIGLSLCGCGSTASSSGSQLQQATVPEHFQQVTQEIDDYIATQKFSGAVLITADGETIYNKAFGNADKSGGIANTTETPFQIGSVTKQMTGAVIINLEQQGKLSTEDTLDKYFSGYDYLQNITIAQVCNMSAGFGDYLEDFLSEIKDNGTVDVEQYTNDYIEHSILEAGTAFSAGTTAQYSNSGYYLLGRIIEQVTGKTVEDYYKTEIFKPCGMESSGVIGNGLDYNKGYTVKGVAVQSPITFDIAYSAGGAVSTTADINRWLNTYFNTNTFYSGDITEKLKEDGFVVDNNTGKLYSYGWNIEPNNVYTHGGTTISYSSNILCDREKDINVIVLSNISYGNDSVTDPMSRKLWHIAENFIKK